jgi:hypothetical protein
MGKRGHEQTPQRSNSNLRVRWVEVELNGSDTTIEEALRAVERMRRPAIEAPPSVKRIANSPASDNGDNTPPDDRTLFDRPVSAQADGASTESVPEAESDVSTADVPRKKRGDGDPKDRNAGIKPVGDIDFVPTGKRSLKDFFSQKAPSFDMDQVLVISYYLQRTLQSSQFGQGHVLSGFKHVGKPVPKDLNRTIRNMKDKKAWLNFTDVENIRLTTEGENRVEHELGKGGHDTGAQ